MATDVAATAFVRAVLEGKVGGRLLATVPNPRSGVVVATERPKQSPASASRQRRSCQRIQGAYEDVELEACCVDREVLDR